MNDIWLYRTLICANHEHMKLQLVTLGQAGWEAVNFSFTPHIPMAPSASSILVLLKKRGDGTEPVHVVNKAAEKREVVQDDGTALTLLEEAKNKRKR